MFPPRAPYPLSWPFDARPRDPYQTYRPVRPLPPLSAPQWTRPAPTAAPMTTPVQELPSPIARDPAMAIPPRMNRLPMSLDEVPDSVADLPPMTEVDARSLPKDVYYDLFGSAHPSLVPVMVEYDRAERNKKLLSDAKRKAITLGRNLNHVTDDLTEKLGNVAQTSMDLQMQAARAAYDFSKPIAKAGYQAADEVGDAIWEFAGDVASMAEDFALYFQSAPNEEKQELLMLLAEFVASLNPAASLAIEIHHFISDPGYRTVANVVLLAASLIPAFRAIRKVPALARLTKRFIEGGKRVRRRVSKVYPPLPPHLKSILIGGVEGAVTKALELHFSNEHSIREWELIVSAGTQGGVSGYTSAKWGHDPLLEPGVKYLTDVLNAGAGPVIESLLREREIVEGLHNAEIDLLYSALKGSLQMAAGLTTSTLLEKHWPMASGAVTEYVTTTFKVAIGHFCDLVILPYFEKAHNIQS